MAIIRTIMFVPGNKADWIEKSVKYGADAVIIDLEDSVPDAEKEAAREIARSSAGRLIASGQRTYVRINKSPHMYSFEDAMAVIQPGLAGIVLSMPNGPEDVAQSASLVAEAEFRNGVEAGSIGIIPALETPRSLQFAYECADHPRVHALIGASSKNADLARLMGFEWQPDSRESLYMKSRVVMACRATGKIPIGGLWQQIRDLDGLRDYARRDRELGMAGQVVLHPSQIGVVHEVFGLSQQDIAYYRGLLEAFDAAVREGRASTMYGDEHIDLAHANMARKALADAQANIRE
jgi:citrate lyase subunit beta/citryl-CoA lyase